MNFHAVSLGFTVTPTATDEQLCSFTDLITWKIQFLPFIVARPYTLSDCVRGSASVMISFPYERACRQLLINWRIPSLLSHKQTTKQTPDTSFDSKSN